MIITAVILFCLEMILPSLLSIIQKNLFFSNILQFLPFLLLFTLCVIGVVERALDSD